MWPWKNNSSSDTADTESDLFPAEEGVHTLSNPYCRDSSCWCHTNLNHHHSVTDFVNEASRPDEQVQFAHRFLNIFG